MMDGYDKVFKNSFKDTWKEKELEWYGKPTKKVKKKTVKEEKKNSNDIIDDWA
jgi:hypothetical protein